MRLSEEEARELGIISANVKVRGAKTPKLTRFAPMPEIKPAKKKSKYGARKVTVDGVKFDSQLEADYYVNLKLLQRAGQIAGFCRQGRFIVTEGANGEIDYGNCKHCGTEVVDTKLVIESVIEREVGLQQSIKRARPVLEKLAEAECEDN